MPPTDACAERWPNQQCAIDHWGEDCRDVTNCSVMCTKNGSYCENEKRETVRGRGSRGMCTKNGSYCEKEKKVVEGQGRCERRSESFVKIQKKKYYYYFFLFIYLYLFILFIYLFYLFIFFWGGGGRRVLAGQGGCERRSAAFVKIQKQLGCRVGGSGVRVVVNGEEKLL